MADDAPRFRPERATGSSRRELGLLVALVLLGLALIARPFWEPRVESGVLVEVEGDVPRPGVHLLDAPTVRSAVDAAGGDPSDLPDTPLHPGDRVVVGEDGVHVAPSGDPMLVGLPVDLNTADAHALQALPGIGPSTALAIVEDRAARGPFYAIEDLLRVPGVGPDALDEVRPYVTVGDVGPRPPPRMLDLNTATASELERLPGIGPVTASRIVVDREDRGPYRTVDDLQRVHGVGPKTVDGLRERVVVEEAR